MAIPVPRRRTERPRRSRPRGMVIPWSANATSESWLVSRGPMLLSLRAWTAGAPEARAASQASRKPGSMIESASSISTASQSRGRACSRPAWRAWARPGVSPAERSSTEAPNERAIRAVESVQRSATTVTRSRGRRSASTASRQRPITCSSLWAGIRTRKRSSGRASRLPLPVEEGSQRQRPQVDRDGQAGQADHGGSEEQRGAHAKSTTGHRGGLVPWREETRAAPRYVVSPP